VLSRLKLAIHLIHVDFTDAYQTDANLLAVGGFAFMTPDGARTILVQSTCTSCAFFYGIPFGCIMFDRFFFSNIIFIIIIFCSAVFGQTVLNRR
jgi:hypothetical protein